MGSRSGNDPLRLPGRFAAAVFDFDGLLVDSEPMWIRAEAELLAAHGGFMTRADEVATHGRSIDESIRIYAKRLGMTRSRGELRAELLERAGELYRTQVEVMPGAEELIRRLTGRIPLAVASNTDHDLVEIALERVGFLGWFDTVVSASDVARPKPWPDAYIEACRRLAVQPADAIGFEDSPTGLEALRSAGLTAVGVHPRPDPHVGGKTHVIESLAVALDWIEDPS